MISPECCFCGSKNIKATAVRVRCDSCDEEFYFVVFPVKVKRTTSKIVQAPLTDQQMEWKVNKKCLNGRVITEEFLMRTYLKEKSTISLFGIPN